VSVSESAIQAAIVQALRLQFPRAIVAAVPNGGSRNVIEAARMKATGTLAGMPDLVVALPNGVTAWLEVKAKKGRISDKQEQLLESLHQLGHHVEIVRDVDDALTFVRGIA
jgi:hypothetical protein